MSEQEVKFVDKRGSDKPARQRFVIYPKCETCAHFENFVNAEGVATKTMLCVVDSPKTTAQISGQDENGNIMFSYSHGWPVVYPKQRCGRHQAREAN
jgi:hypothetical protein